MIAIMPSWILVLSLICEIFQRLCACGSSTDINGMQSTGALFHTIFNVQTTRYFEWQSRFFMFWAKVLPRPACCTAHHADTRQPLTRRPHAQQAGQPGDVTRLLSSNGADHLMATVNTHVSPPWDMVRRQLVYYRPRHALTIPVEQSKDPYLPYNKPMSIIHWLQNAKPKADVIIIMDPDCLMFKPLDIVRHLFVRPPRLLLTPRQVVEQGRPIGQKAFFDFHRSASDGDRTCCSPLPPAAPS